MFSSVISRAAHGVDRAVSQAMDLQARRMQSRWRRPALSADERVAAFERVEADYNHPRFFADPDAFFGPANPPAVLESAVRRLPEGGRVVDLRWPSACEPIDRDVSARYLACEANRSAAARAFFHGPRPRPTVLLVHGYLGGRYGFEERMWPRSWLAARGFDTVFTVLPFHGVRRDPRRTVPMFPAADARITIEGFRQAIGDLRGLAAWLRARGVPQLGVMGMSLGGYTASLFATLDPDLAFLVPVIPLASIADLARDGDRFVGSADERLAQHRALDRAMRVVSPFARPSLMPAGRTVVLAAEGDAITPLAHARRLADHLHAPLEVFPGGHLLQVGRARAFEAVGRMLDRAGFPRS